MLRHTVRKERPAPVVRTAPHRNAAGHDLGTVDLEPTVFGLEPNRAVLHQVVTAQLAAARAGTQSTKTRAEVRGGGAKPFRQKGTGRARQGSSRSPSMIGGGVALGPKPRSYAQRTPRKMVRLALLSALSDRADIGQIVVVDDWKIEAPKTKDAAVIVRKLKLSGSVLVVLGQDELDVERSFANLPQVQTTTFGELSAHDVLRADWLVFSDRTLPAAASDFSGTHVVEAAEAPEPPAKAERRPTKARREGRRRSRQGAEGHEGRRQARGSRRAEVEPFADVDATEAAGGGERRGGRHRCVTPCPCSSARSSPRRATRSWTGASTSSSSTPGPPRSRSATPSSRPSACGAVTKVNTLNRKGKATRNRRTNVKGKRPDTKRAIVTLHPDDSIDLFES